MPRKSVAKKVEEPSSDDVSAQSDVEMQDQQDDKMSGFKKFGSQYNVDTPDYTDSDTNPNTTANSVAGDSAPADGRKRRAEEMNMRKSMYGKKAEGLRASKEDDTIRRFRYLLGLTDLFRHFIDTNPNPRIKEILAEIDRQDAEETKKSKASKVRKGGAAAERRRKTEQEEDAELVREEKHGGHNETVFRESPGFIKGGTMRDYQVAGLNWLISLHENGISGILADEMGLGKTLQTISFIGYLRYIAGITGPHLVAVPKSTLDNWKREFAKWCPEVNVLVLQGNKDDRADLIKERLVPDSFDVCITSYEMILREKSHLKKFAWEYIIIDEAHRIKNESSSLAQMVRAFNSRSRLLITGTPLQNNLHELWALLNFLLPDVFGDSAAFDDWFSQQNADSDAIVKQLHKVLRPFLLRRVKADVEKSLLPKKEINLYVGMSDMQVQWYKKILEKDIDAVNGGAGNKESKTRLLNIVMQLRKCCNHPYLFEGAEPGPPYTTDEHLVTNAAKMVMLDKLLKRMKAQGSRVLIFSQMSRVLDIMEDYSVMRGYQYCRIDGSTAHEDRIQAIDDYNKEGSEKFLFLLTTRAGGLGINLTSADIVVLFDSDWNPQADLQAMDRAHRIGQTKQVYVFRFVTEMAIEEKVLERAAQKLRLDQLVIQQGRTQQPAKNAASKDELLTMIQHGAEAVFKSKGPVGPAADGELADDDFDAVMRRGEEMTEKLNKRYETLGLDDLQKFTSDSTYEWNGETFQPRKKEVGISWINPSKRERKEQNYGIDSYYHHYEGISEEVDARMQRRLKRTQGVWKKYKTLDNWQKHLGVIEEGELRVRQSEEKKRLIAKKISMYRMPLQQMQIKYTVSTTNKKVYTEEEDKFLVVMLHKYGVEGDLIYEKIRDEIRESPLFRFDWFFLSRTPQEIGRRCTTLISAIVRELGDGDLKNKNGKRGYDEEETEEEEEQPKKKTKNGVKLDTVKAKGSPASATPSRASSVATNGSATKGSTTKGKGKGKKK
ncbi:ISWI chromatin-remodeling complex ATPase ISW2 [Pyrenophora tritici-repentis Pt-1C-BFP]|uniref:ISWI chromatin-remodeling complex ATPase ISW2 n=1 Tax=Pyrenophora tritici-repentis (strain Pt-1C-BFP) TaxID=426418 RepID=B2VVF1_PYRTR|nr:ISWI chromatin-remodeling complex ATPase ISW2 [Pyrenophora tritici-repentis Pt-1C-BFP]EDU41704.1 ISWI chromatin-remodeling complex ATPase ISW2 [Pyrenophora tritici-repentis Pt-1C-BFP]